MEEESFEDMILGARWPIAIAFSLWLLALPAALLLIDYGWPIRTTEAGLNTLALAGISLLYWFSCVWLALLTGIDFVKQKFGKA